jgi:hypothetical protein
MISRAVILLGAALLACRATAGDAPTGSASLQRNVVFTEYSPLSRSTELLRRWFSPLNALARSCGLDQLGQALARAAR